LPCFFGSSCIWARVKMEIIYDITGSFSLAASTVSASVHQWIKFHNAKGSTYYSFFLVPVLTSKVVAEVSCSWVWVLQLSFKLVKQSTSRTLIGWWHLQVVVIEGKQHKFRERQSVCNHKISQVWNLLIFSKFSHGNDPPSFVKTAVKSYMICITFLKELSESVWYLKVLQCLIQIT
jgi:hypothetical protein